MSFSPPNLLVFVCEHVFSRELPILVVSHADGDWQFLCGGDHEGQKPRIVCVSHVLGVDESLNELADLAVDEEAERKSATDAWVRLA